MPRSFAIGLFAVALLGADPAWANKCDFVEGALNRDPKLFVNALMAHSRFFHAGDCQVFMEDRTAGCHGSHDPEPARRLFGAKVDAEHGVRMIAKDAIDCGLEITKQTVGPQNKDDFSNDQSRIHIHLGDVLLFYIMNVYPDWVQYEVWIEENRVKN